MIDIAAIKARADKAPKGPWKDIPWHITEGAPEVRVAEGWLLCAVSSDTHAEFIAHARTDIPALIAALEASEAARVKAEQERDALKDALTNSCDLLESYIDTFGDMSGANRADLNDYRAVLTAYDKRSA